MTDVRAVAASHSCVPVSVHLTWGTSMYYTVGRVLRDIRRVGPVRWGTKYILSIYLFFLELGLAGCFCSDGSGLSCDNHKFFIWVLLLKNSVWDMRNKKSHHHVQVYLIVAGNRLGISKLIYFKSCRYLPRQFILMSNNSCHNTNRYLPMIPCGLRFNNLTLEI